MAGSVPRPAPVSVQSRTPFFLQLLFICSLAALLPAIHAFYRDDLATTRIFVFAMLLGLALALILRLATAANRSQINVRSQLFTLLLAFGLLPILLAVPFHVAAGERSFLDSWFEMVSSFTTTGATVFEGQGRLSPTLHLWRALVGWLGGLLIWITALAIFAPLNLGGFEVRFGSGLNEPVRGAGRFIRAIDPVERLERFALRLAPIYIGLTFLLTLGLLLAGEVPLVAFCHAMSTLSTSGISPIAGTPYGASGMVGEMLMAGFMIFALSHLAFGRGLLAEDTGRLRHDAELRLALILVCLVTAALFLRHFIGGTQADASGLTSPIIGGAQALWGAFFTVLSFLTTTGFESYHWLGAADWSGLRTPGMVLMGLALIGGGVATTAGGVKLLRVYALSRHGQRELERLIHPHSIGGAGSQGRRVRREGARIAWVFFMLFALSIVIVMGLLTLTGLQFETATILAVAALSTTGPLADVAGQWPIAYSGMPAEGKVILGLAMILGRLEALALLALFNPELWRS